MADGGVLWCKPVVSPDTPSMAARTPPPPATGIPPGHYQTTNGHMASNGTLELEEQDEPATTTISTIAIHAGSNSQIIIALLRSADYVHVRVDQMVPPLLAIGVDLREARRLLHIHSDLMHRLSEKEEQVDALLARADALPQEKDEKEAPVYAAMARSLNTAWRELMRRLSLRGDLLLDVNMFYDLYEKHQQAVHRAASSTTETVLDEIVDLTARAMDFGASIIGQIRVLGETSDNEERAQEILEASETIENIMLRMSSEWEKLESEKTIQKRVVEDTQESLSVEEVIEEVEHWLNHARRRVKASNEYGLRTIEQEAEIQKKRLKGIQHTKVVTLVEQIEALVSSIKNNLDGSQKIQNFFVAANNMWQQLCSMERDMQNANEAMAGELAPLAVQKALSLKAQGEELQASGELTHEERRQVAIKTKEIIEKAHDIQALAMQRSDSGKEVARENLRKGREWLVREAEPWLERHGNMGGTLQTATKFVQKHKEFARTVEERDYALTFAFNESSRLNEDEQKSSKEFKEKYDKMKKVLDTRIQLGDTFHQMNQFATELNSSFDSLEHLLDSQQDVSTERGVAHMGHVFEVIQETLGQERQQGERFISSAQSTRSTDGSLKAEEAIETTRSIMVEHERRFSQMAEKWHKWQQKKVETTHTVTGIDEVYAWQDQVQPEIRTLEQTTTEGNEENIRRMRNEVNQQTQKIQKIQLETATDEHMTRRADEVIRRQREIDERLINVERKIEETQQATDQRLQEKKEVVKVVELIQASQSMCFDALQNLETTTVETTDQGEEKIKRIKQVHEAVDEQTPKVEWVTTQQAARDEDVSHLVDETIRRQHELAYRIDKVDRQVAEETKVVVEQKKELIEVVKVIEEVWPIQEQCFTQIRDLEEETIKSTRDSEKYVEKIEQIQHAIEEQIPKVEYVSRSEVARANQQIAPKVDDTVRRHHELTFRIDKVARQTAEVTKTIALQELEKVEVVRVIDELFPVQEQCFKTIQALEDRTLKTLQDSDLHIKEVAKVHHAIIEQGPKVEFISKSEIARADENLNRKIDDTVKRHYELVDRLERVEKKSVEVTQAIKAKEKDKVEVVRVIDEVVPVHEECSKTIKILEETKLETPQQCELHIKQVKQVHHAIIEQGPKVEWMSRTHAANDDEILTKKIQATVEKQKELEERIQLVEKKTTEKAIEIEKKEKEKLTITRIVEEIQMWQEECVEIIRNLEDAKVETTEEIEAHDKVVRAVRSTADQQSEKLKQVIRERTVQDEQLTRTINDTLKKQQEFDARLQLIERRTQEAVEQKQKEKQQLVRVVEEVEMWQEQCQEIIRVLDQATVKTVKQSETHTKEVQGVRNALNQQTDKIERIAKTEFARDEDMRTKIENATRRQHELDQKLAQIEEKSERLRETVEREEKQRSEVMKVLEEVQMWQEDCVQIIRNLEDAKVQTAADNESHIRRVEEVRNVLTQQAPKIQWIAKSDVLRVDEQLAQTVSQAARTQHELETRLQQVELKANQMAKTVAEQEKEKQDVEKVIEEVQMWQEDTYETIRRIDNAPTQTVQQCQEQVSQVRDIRQALIQQAPKIDRINRSKVARSDERISQKIDETINRQTQVEEKLTQLETKVNEKAQETAKKERERNEVSKIIDDVQMWQEDTYEIIHQVDTTQVETVKQSEEQVSRVNEIRRSFIQQAPKIERISKSEARTDETINEKIEQTLKRHGQIQEKLTQLEEKVNQQAQVTARREKEKAEVSRIIEEVQMWQEDAQEILHQIGTTKAETVRDTEQQVTKVQDVRRSFIQQSPKVERIAKSELRKDTRINERIEQTLRRQSQIEEQLNQVEQKVEQMAKETARREQEKAEVSRIIEEVQKWQEDTYEVIKKVESTRVETIKDSEQQVSRVKEIRNAFISQSPKVERISRSEIRTDQTMNEKIEQTLRRHSQLEEKLNKLETKVSEDAQRTAVREKEKAEVSRIIEEIQMWQVDAHEKIRKVEEKKIETVEESQSTTQQVKQLRQSCDQQKPKIEKICTSEVTRTDETLYHTVDDVVKRQYELEKRIEQVEKKTSEASQRIAREEEEKRDMIRTLDEVQQWQDSTSEIIRNLEQQPIQTAPDAEIFVGRVRDVRRTFLEAAPKIERIAKSHLAQSGPIGQRVSGIVQRQKELEARLEKVEEKGIAAREEIAALQRETVQVEKLLEEIQMWQEDIVEVLKNLENARVTTIADSEVHFKRVREARQSFNQQKPKVERISKSRVREVNEELSKKIDHVLAKQKTLTERMEKIEKNISEIIDTLATTEKEKAELIRVIEEVWMWQDDCFETILALEEIPQPEVHIQKVNNMRQASVGMGPKIEHICSSHLPRTDDYFAKRASDIVQRQRELEQKIGVVEREAMKVEKITLQKSEANPLLRILEEIEMWQNDAVEIIRTLETTTLKTEVEKESFQSKLTQLRNSYEVQTKKLEKVKTEVRDETTARAVEKVVGRQREIGEKINKVGQRLAEYAATTQVRKPTILVGLRDSVIEEGQRFEFAAKIDSAPEPDIRWLKDGIDIGQSMDYRTTFVNGIATLSIEETFIEDSAVYTIRVTNPSGFAECSATLTVRSSSAQSVEDRPRIIRSLKNTTVEEGESLQLDCVIQSIPEPQVIWYKEEETLKEDERVQLEFRGDHCSLTIHPAKASDSGVYSCRARNVHGQVTSLCQVKVHRKPPPPTPPKPSTAYRSGTIRPPTIQPTLTNATYPLGAKAVLKVNVSGNPPPVIVWSHNEKPVKTSTRVRIEEEADGWTRLVIDDIQSLDAGMYTVTAENEAGEARTGATIHVQKKMTTIGTMDNDHTITMITQQKMPVVQETKKAEPQTASGGRVLVDRSLDGFWSDGFTGSPTPPPIPAHKSQTEEYLQRDVKEIGLSNTATVPEFFRSLHHEYTVNEEEHIKLECLLVGNPRPKVKWLFNERLIHANSKFAEIRNSGDSYSITIGPAKLEHAGYYKIVAENVKGMVEAETVLHVRPKALLEQHKGKKATREHQKVSEEFAMFEYEQRIPDASHIPVLKKQPSLERKRQTEMLEEYSLDERRLAPGAGPASSGPPPTAGGHPPHFTQTLVSAVCADGQAAKFEGIVTGYPSPEVTWTKDGAEVTRVTHPHLLFSNIGGRVSLAFPSCQIADAGKYKCEATNSSGVATSSAQLVVRPRTVAPDFVSRLISEEVAEGEQLKWTVKVTGDPTPKVTWIRDGVAVPNCDEVRIIEEGDGTHSLIIVRVESADSGQFTCLAENVAGEARSTADLVVRSKGTQPGHYFHVTKVTQEKQVKGADPTRNQTFTIQTPLV